jgi:hypothetical protein
MIVPQIAYKSFLSDSFLFIDGIIDTDRYISGKANRLMSRFMDG